MNEPYVIRPVQQEDYEDILALAKTANPGLTNLLPDENLIKQNIRWSLESFRKNITSPERELYFFVLEDIKAKKVVGTCGIFSDVGDEFYSFKVSRELVSSELLNIRKENHYLQLVNDYKNVSELGLLLVNKKYRRLGLGKFLSRSRYLFLADHLERFHAHLIAEMRGKIDMWGKSVFWDALGSHFIDIKFTEADYLSATNKKHFIPELFPHTPIPVALLPESAKKAIGSAHPDTAAAVSVLLQEGFEYSHYVDIFDGGPTLEVVLKQIHTINKSQRAVVSAVGETITGQECMISFQGEHYRISIGNIIINDNGSVDISSKLANILSCKVGDTIRYIII